MSKKKLGASNGDKENEKKKKPRVKNTIQQLFLSKSSNTQEDTHDTIEEENDLPELQINEVQREELFITTLEMICDANRIYQTKTAAMHKKIFQLEEVTEKNSNKKKIQKKTLKNIFFNFFFKVISGMDNFKRSITIRYPIGKNSKFPNDIQSTRSNKRLCGS